MQHLRTERARACRGYADLVEAVLSTLSEEAPGRAGAAVLFSRGIGGGIRAARTYALTARFHGLSLFRRPVIDRYHARGARVVAFLPETDDDARAAVEAGVDEVLTDRRRLS